ncbi:hypothetical protein PJM54_28995, partial [Mycobacterium kansasii]
QALAQLVLRAPRELSGYINLVRAELAERQGDPQGAVGLYRSLLSQDPDAYTEGVLADVLLDQGRAAEVLSLLRGRERNDG